MRITVVIDVERDSHVDHRTLQLAEHIMGDVTTRVRYLTGTQPASTFRTPEPDSPPRTVILEVLGFENDPADPEAGATTRFTFQGEEF